jgi:hypothetical protein
LFRLIEGDGVLLDVVHTAANSCWKYWAMITLAHVVQQTADKAVVRRIEALRKRCLAHNSHSEECFQKSVKSKPGA